MQHGLCYNMYINNYYKVILMLHHSVTDHSQSQDPLNIQNKIQ